MKISLLGAHVFHMGGRTDRHDNGNSRFQNFAKAPKIEYCT